MNCSKIKILIKPRTKYGMSIVENLTNIKNLRLKEILNN